MTALAALFLFAQTVPAAGGDDRLPIFDTHLHYSENAWAGFDPRAVVAALRAANVPRALVSSSPDDGTLKLVEQDAARFVPILRPYRAGVTPGNWVQDPDTPSYIAERLRRGNYRGLGEFHLFDEADAGAPHVSKLAAMAVERDIVLHVHGGAGPVRTLLANEPKLKILWAHAGMSTPPSVIGALLDRHPRVWADLAFRAGEIASAGRLDPAWRELLLRHSDRFMVGTDTYIASRWAGYGALVEEHRRWLAELPRDVARAIAYENAARQFGAR